ncbi:MAG: hypothetical protein AB1817_10505 [Chloroflexota bacterium]
MPPQTGSEEKYQIATLVVLTITGLVIVYYALIFINPRVAFNPFKPPLPTATLIAALPILQPTWTPTQVAPPTPTTTPTASATATLVVPPQPTLLPSTATSTPTVSPTATPRLPTRTPAPKVAAPTAVPAAYSYRATLNCSHSGGTQIKGTVSSGGQPQEGVRVRVATSPDPATVIEGGEQFTRRQPDGSAGYAFVLMTTGAFDPPATWHIWITDGTGTPISDPNFHFQTNNYSRDNPLACWLAIVDFAK